MEIQGIHINQDRILHIRVIYTKKNCIYLYKSNQNMNGVAENVENVNSSEFCLQINTIKTKNKKIKLVKCNNSTLKRRSTNKKI